VGTTGRSVNKLGKQTIATGISYAFLVTIVSGASRILAGEDSFVTTAIVANAIATSTALTAWSGALFQKMGAGIQPPGFLGWIGLFVAGVLTSALFLFIDCGHHLPSALGGVECDGKSGVGIVFTIAAMSMTAISLPSALRVWLIKKLA